MSIPFAGSLAVSSAEQGCRANSGRWWKKKTRESKGGTAQLCVAGNLAGTHVKAGKNVLQLISNV